MLHGGMEEGNREKYENTCVQGPGLNVQAAGSKSVKHARFHNMGAHMKLGTWTF